MPSLATWMRGKDQEWFQPFFDKHPDIPVCNARKGGVAIEKMDGLLLTGGSDIAPEFLRQEIVDPSVLDKDVDPARDRWEFAAVKDALSRGLPILAICKGLQVFNVALGGTLKLDIPGHKLPEQKEHDIQPLRSDATATHRFDRVNSSHHQAIDPRPPPRRRHHAIVSAKVSKWKRGARPITSSSKSASAIIRSRLLCNIIPSAAKFTVSCLKISSRG